MINEGDIAKYLDNVKTEKINKELLKKIYSLIDHTSLNTDDNKDKIENFCKSIIKNIKREQVFPAAICVYPNFISIVKNTLDTYLKDIKIASVAGNFPTSQTFISVKLAECELCLDKGADELDIVMPIGLYNQGDYGDIANQISLIKSIVKDKTLKVILETGLLTNYKDIYGASLLAMKSGADFIKTSTGKEKVSAGPEAVFVMCLAIKEYYKNTGKKTGIKPSGGISNISSAVMYYSIVKDVLGEDWLNNNLFRFGSSRLAENIMAEITK